MRILSAALLIASASPLLAAQLENLPSLPRVAAPIAAPILPTLETASPAPAAAPAEAPKAAVQLGAAIPQASATPQSGESAKAAADAAFTGGKPQAPSSDAPVVEPAQAPAGPSLTPSAPKSTPPAPSRFWTHLPALSLGGSAAMIVPALALHAVQQALGTGSILTLAVAGLQLVYWGGIGLTVATGLWRGKIAKREHPVERGAMGFVIGALGAGAVALGLALTAMSFYAG